MLPQGPLYAVVDTVLGRESLMTKNIYQKAMVLETNREVDEVCIFYQFEKQETEWENITKIDC